MRFIVILLFAFSFQIKAQSLSASMPLDLKLSDISGILAYENSFLALNDAGDAPILYQLNAKSFQIEHKIKIENATNYDWEDLTQDEDYIYIADIGNNSGNRQNLKIYKVSKSEFAQGKTHAEIISFQYEDQDYFQQLYENHSYDAEAIVATDNELLLFTKDWKNKTTQVYSLPKVEGFHYAEKIAVYSVEGLISSASFSKDKNELVLLGKENDKNFIVSIAPFKVENNFNSLFTKTYIEESLENWEGITFLPNRNSLLITSQGKFNKNSNEKPYVFEMKL